MLTVRKLADLAGISVRTLHYYDEIGLLKPAVRKNNNYRYYDDDAVIRLQQILFFRELDFALEDIRTIMSRDDFDIVEGLREHRGLLMRKRDRLEDLIATLDKTIRNRNGEQSMDIKEYYEGFSEELIDRYRDEVKRRWGEETLKDSEDRIMAMGKVNFMEIQAEGGRIFSRIYENMSLGHKSEYVQDLIGEWRLWLENFHHYTDEEVVGLGRAYSHNYEFARFFHQYHQDLPLFLTRAIEYYYSRKGSKRRKKNT